MTDHSAVLRPAEFSRLLIGSLAASEGRRKRRKRDQTPDRIGLELKRELLERAIAADPDPADFEGWLLMQALTAPASGPARAICGMILDEYRLAGVDPDFQRWLSEGAYSEDAEANRPTTEAGAGPRTERPRHPG